ncbi:hypothetical protein K456DRAFT_1761526 [Colletotrichum gloeosporioides 23]|nr:hypothetical protein K456DRAFT_1761526 [Colletotrichum gloeosporioides 23]
MTRWPHSAKTGRPVLHVRQLHHHYGPRVASDRESAVWFAQHGEAAFTRKAAITTFAEELVRGLWIPQTKAFITQQLRRRLHRGGDEDPGNPINHIQGRHVARPAKKIGFSLRPHKREQGDRGRYYACHAEKQLVAYFTSKHLFRENVEDVIGLGKLGVDELADDIARRREAVFVDTACPAPPYYLGVSFRPAVPSFLPQASACPLHAPQPAPYDDPPFGFR